MPLPLLGLAAPTVMGFLFAALRIFMLANIVGFVMRVLVAFGLNIILVEPAIEAIMSILSRQFNVIPQAAADWVGFLNLDRYVGLILSGYAIHQATNFILRINR